MPPRYGEQGQHIARVAYSIHSRSEGAEISIAIRVSDDFAWHHPEFKVRARAQTLMVFSELLAPSKLGGRNRECPMGCAQCHET